MLLRGDISGIITLLCCGIALLSCNKKEYVNRSGEADFSKIAVIGGNYLSGYQDGALYEKGQRNSIPLLFAQHAPVAGGSSMELPLIQKEGGVGINLKPWESHFNAKSRLNYRTDCKGEESLGPVKNLYDNEPFADLSANSFGSLGQNMAVPYASTADILNPDFGLGYDAGNLNPFYHRMASDPGNSTMLGDIVSYDPTFFLAWIGMEDIYNYAFYGGSIGEIPSAGEFRNNLDSILSELTKNGAKGAIANIPAIENFPFFNLIPYNGANVNQGKADTLNISYADFQHIYFTEGDNAFVLQDDHASMGIRQMVHGEKILFTVPLDSIKCQLYGLIFSVIGNRYMLNIHQLDKIQTAIVVFNEIIKSKAEEYELAFVDMHHYFEKVQKGVKWNGVDFNLEFVSGGFLSLDGYHPNQKGYALITNEFIHSVNAKYNAKIPIVNCQDCDGVLFP